MRGSTTKGERIWPAVVAAAAVLLLTAPHAFASRTAPARPDLLTAPALQPISVTKTLAPVYASRGFALRLDTDPHPATFALFDDLAPASEHVEPEKLASGVESWALTPNLQRIQIFVTDSRWCREFLGPIDSPNLYQAFGLDPMNVTDPLGLCGWWSDTPCMEEIRQGWSGVKASAQAFLARFNRGTATPADPEYADAAEAVGEKERQEQEVGAATQALGKTGSVVGDTALRVMPGPGTLIGLAEAQEDARAGRWGAAALGVVGAGLDVVPGAGKVDDAVRAGRRLRTAGTRFERAAADGADGLRLANGLVGRGSPIRPYSELRHLTAGYRGDFQAHHILEQRHLARWGHSEREISEVPSQILSRAEHQALNAKLAEVLPTGRAYSRAEVWKQYEIVYEERPEYLAAIRHYFE